MPRPMLFATTADDARNSIQKYQQAIERSVKLQERMPYARAWYAIQDQGKFIFCPSKWAGYMSMHESTYLASDSPMDGRKTEVRLAQWFEIVPATEYLHDVLHKGLREFLGGFGREPSRVARISVPKTMLEKEVATESVSALVVRLIRALSPDQQAEIKRGLR